jgi:hypothetical protein
LEEVQKTIEAFIEVNINICICSIHYEWENSGQRTKDGIFIQSQSQPWGLEELLAKKKRFFQK